MYRVHLSESLFPLRTDEPIWEITVGELLRDVAARDPGAPALVEVDIRGQSARRWTYGELLADSERLAHALGTRFFQIAGTIGHELVRLGMCLPVRRSVLGPLTER